MFIRDDDVLFVCRIYKVFEVENIYILSSHTEQIFSQNNSIHLLFSL